MCLAVPGKIIRIVRSEDAPMLGGIGTVDFQGSRIEVSLQFTPSAAEGNWVLVHAGFALQILNDAEAREIWEYLQAADLTADLPPEFHAAAINKESPDQESGK